LFVWNLESNDSVQRGSREKVEMLETFQVCEQQLVVETTTGPTGWVWFAFLAHIAAMCVGALL
jgi:hypothetical protein